MRFFTYGRKSVYSDHSDSIDNQFRMNRDFCEAKFTGQIDSWQQFSDEDFTGATTDRPDLKDMLLRIRAGECDVLVVYQLDRLSRDVRDFANIYATLEEHHVNFVSIKENIDTDTPIGKAMMYITATFAQLERETIANRVADNMTGLARKGYWVGGNPPVGYVRQRIVSGGRRHVTLVPDPENVLYVRWVFNTFLDNHFSLQNMETYFRKQGIRTRAGNFFSTTQIYAILTNPFYVEAAPEVYDYFAAKGCQMDEGSPREKWKGTCAVAVYGRTTERNKKHEKQPPEKWLVCLGKHQPLLSAKTWLAAQDRLSKNVFDRTMKYDVPLLKGVLRCRCGSLMQVSRKKKIDGSVSSWYYCNRRMRQGKDVCSMPQIKTDKLDKKVLEIFRTIDADPTLIRKYVKEAPAQNKRNAADLSRQITACEAKIGRMTAAIALAEESSAQKYLVAEIERLDLERAALKREWFLAVAEEREKEARFQDASRKAVEISRLLKNFGQFSASEKNAIIRHLIRGCTWNGEELFLSL